MSQRLARTVTIYPDGKKFRYQAGDVPSEEHAELITNPAAWEPEAASFRRAHQDAVDRKNSNEDLQVDHGIPTLNGKPDYEGLTVKVLRDHAYDREISLSGCKGVKSAIIERLEEADAAEIEGLADAEDEEMTYEDMSVLELKAQIEARNETRAEGDALALNGNKAALIARLEADDETYAEDDED